MAALLFCAFVFLSAKNAAFMARTHRVSRLALSLVWLVLFIMNLGPVVADLAGPKLLYGNPEAKIDLYFSPTCPACLEAVRTFGKAADFYAVAENDYDLAVIADLTRSISGGESLEEAMNKISAAREAGTYSAPAPDLPQELSLRFDALRNQARISRLGFKAVPVILFEGLPPNWARAEHKDAASASGAQAPAALTDDSRPARTLAAPALPREEPDGNTADFLPDLSEKPLVCSQDTAEPCP
jgi:thiol-disulfide isomerase/thioredoxin